MPTYKCPETVHKSILPRVCRVGYKIETLRKRMESEYLECIQICNALNLLQEMFLCYSSPMEIWLLTSL